MDEGKTDRCLALVARRPVGDAPSRAAPRLHTSTATQSGGNEISAAATAAAQAYLEKIGLRSVLDEGAVRLHKQTPLPASALAAWLVFATEVTQTIKAQSHGRSNDAVASAMLAGFESLVREEERGRRQKGWCVF